MITITREKKFNRQGWQWIYNLVGPDNYHSTDKNLPALRQMAGRRYPGVEIVEEWKQEDWPPDTSPALEARIGKLMAVAIAAQEYIDACVCDGDGTTELLALDATLNELKGETT